MSSDLPPDRKEPTNPPQAPAVSDIANIERTFLRLTFWQTVLSLAGVFTGVVALYAALNESRAVREQTAASVWPYIQIIINDTDNGTSARFALSFENVGVGPALMRGVELRLSGEPVRTWDDMASRLLGEAARVGVDFGRNSVSSLVIGPAEEVVAFQTNQRKLALAVQKAMYGGQASLRYCFCSIFDQCWLGNLQQKTGHTKPKPIETCPDFGGAAFLD